MSSKFAISVTIAMVVGFIIGAGTSRTKNSNDFRESLTPGSIAILGEIRTGALGNLYWLEYFPYDLFALEAKGILERDYETEIEDKAKYPVIRLTAYGEEIIADLFPDVPDTPNYSDRTRCHVHEDIILRKEPVKIMWGNYQLSLIGEKYREAEQFLFPNAPLVTHYGVKISDDTHELIKVCSECIVTREDWLRDHPLFDDRTDSEQDESLKP